MKELIDKLKQNPDFLKFEEWAVNEIEKLDSVAGLDQMSNELAGEEAKVRILAKNKIIAILAPFINYAGKKEISEDQRKEATERFRL